MNTHETDDDLFREAEKFEAEGADDPGTESDEEVDGEVDARGAVAIRRRNR